MGNVEEDIPAFPMWKMFNKDIIPALIKMEYSDRNLQELTDTIKTTEFSSIFVYVREPNTSVEEYEKKCRSYKAFTVWMLGRFFYLLSCDNLSKIHDLVLEAQVRILRYLSMTQPDGYDELCAEYVSALKQLNSYYISTAQKSEDLKVFEPVYTDELKDKLNLNLVPVSVTSKAVCINIQKRLIKIIYEILLQNTENCYYNRIVCEGVDCLQFILKECNIELKLLVVKAHVDLLKSNQIHFKGTNDIFLNKFNYFIPLFEVLVNSVYNKNCIILESNFKEMEKILMLLFVYCTTEGNIGVKVRQMAILVHKETSSKELQDTSFKYMVETQTLEFLHHINDYIEKIINNGEYHLIEIFKKQILCELQMQHVSQLWNTLVEAVRNKFTCDQATLCDDKCPLSEDLTLLTKIAGTSLELQIKSHEPELRLKVFDDLVKNILVKTHNHLHFCKHKDLVGECILKLFAILPEVTHMEEIFYCFAHGFENQTGAMLKTKMNVAGNVNIYSIFQYTANTTLQNEMVLLCSFMHGVSSRILNVNWERVHMKNLCTDYMTVLRKSLNNTIHTLSLMDLTKVLQYPVVFNVMDQWVNYVIWPALQTLSSELLPAVIESAANCICLSSSHFLQVVSWSGVDIKFEICCLTCKKESICTDTYELKPVLDQLKNTQMAYKVFPPISANVQNFQSTLSTILAMSTHENTDVRLAIVKSLPAFTHIASFFLVENVKLWLKFANDTDKKIRVEFSLVIFFIFSVVKDSQVLSTDNKEMIVNTCFLELERCTKLSLQKSNYELQDTLLDTIGELSKITYEVITKQITQILLYYIMIPTSNYPWIASHIFIEMANQQGTSTNVLYVQNKKELSKRIMTLSAINQSLIDYNLVTSLEKISVVLCFYGSKDFVTKEARHLLPKLLSLIVSTSKVEKLVEEFANLLEISLSELLTTHYGYIFLHLFLNETEDTFKKLMKYVEKNTGCSGKSLRKKDFLVILHELLLNFHGKRDRVLSGLRILAKDDLEGQTLSVKQMPDYLNPKLLGVLVYFDMRLIARHLDKTEVLMGLAELVTFMGPKYVTPLRFKVLAMMKTALSSNSGTSYEINCHVWEAFLKSCEIDALGPQLASIFVSLLPLLETCPEKITALFKYLIIRNEMYVKDYICDLFFVLDSGVDDEICKVIRKYLQPIESMPFEEQLKSFLRYLNYETIDIRVHGLKYIKRLLEKNREVVDRMILGYNGIDPVIVNLLDILMDTCREKEHDIKLACGECIGELGAIDPSHLPRHCKQEIKKFVFFLTEDVFVTNALSELVRALQAEKNTHNMDRFSLAIQEILKVYGISPEASSQRHALWKQFPDSQQEVMLPLLSSHYTMLHPLEKVSDVPIYGSKYGSTFHSWVSTWTSNLILEIKPDNRSLLQVCLPSLKQDHNTLMTFLPHILLHALLDSNANVHTSIYDEFMAVINSFSNRETALPILNIKPLSDGASLTKSRISPEEKVIFVILDFLDRWVREWICKNGASSTQTEEYNIINTFLSKFCKLGLAKANYQCGEYARSLMYIEEYIQKHPDDLTNQFSFLTELYAQLDEPDGVAGVTAMQVTEPPLEQRLLSLEVSGKLADAIACYEQIPPPLKPHHFQCLIQCYLDLDNVNTALNFARGALETQPNCRSLLLEAQAEPLWRLSRYTELNKLLEKDELRNNHSWSVEMGRSLIHLQNNKEDEFNNVLNSLSIAQVELLGAASLKEGAYQHGYSYVARLHAINELKQIANLVRDLHVRSNDHKISESLIKKLMSEWELRLKVVQESIRIREPILCLRRVGIQQAKQLLTEKVSHSVPLLNSILGESWLQSATIARTAGVHQQAFTYTLKADEYAPPRLFIEKAKLHWLREEHEQALSTLQRGLEILVPDNLTNTTSSYSNANTDNRKIQAEVKLLIASYNEAISNVETDVNKQHYKDAVDVFNQWEKSLVCLAQYYDRIFNTLSDSEKEREESDMKVLMINFFGRSLLYGSEYVYQSMPRMLSIWFDYGTHVFNLSSGMCTTKQGGKGKLDKENTLLQMTKLIDTFLERLPSYIFLTAFSQIVSRICHPQKQVYMELKSIIVKLILQYPQQTLWMLISVIKSRCAIRSRRCSEILNDGRLKTPNMIKMINDFTKLAEKLIELCNKEIADNVQVTYVSTLLKSLPRLLTRDDFSEIMIPIQKFRKLILPNPDFQNTQHNPFPNRYVYIVGIEDEITVLQSMQHPRKITFRGSDGKKYTQMLKPKDDLRKDFRLMEFNDVVNQMLSRDSDSRQRRLHIRLYSVVPLNEECGLIEWIPDLVGFRPAIMALYKQRGLGASGRELKQLFCDQRDPLTKKKVVFLTKLLPKHPPIFNEWFRITFPDPQSWLAARTSYIHTTAAISMVGYILGLGDRHGENILFDSTCGDTVHVDFNCLFNKGETLQWPERVPFRLTQNMVAAMGPLGVEGVFRKSCACTLSVLRSHIDILMSIVTPFVYDPLVSWSRKSMPNSTSLIAEQQNLQAVEHIRNIEQRLKGITRSRKSSAAIPLSVDGQTNNQIQEAMSIDNLCQMYIGWGAYL